MTNSKIIGGYILQPRIIDDSDAMNMPPLIREVWFWLHRNVNFANGRVKRGQILTSTGKIRESLKWKSGYRFEYYPLDRISKALARLKDEGMISIDKRGNRKLMISVCNYDFYQDKSNYTLDSPGYSVEVYEVDSGGKNSVVRRQFQNDTAAKTLQAEKPMTLGFGIDEKSTVAISKSDGGKNSGVRRQKLTTAAKTTKPESKAPPRKKGDEKTTAAIPIITLKKNTTLLNLSSDKFTVELCSKSLGHICRVFFEEYYKTIKPEPYYWKAKDGTNMSNIISTLKFLIKKKPENEFTPILDQLVLDSWCTVLNNLSVDKWVYDNLSIPNINSKFNELITKIRKGKTQQQNDNRRKTSNSRAKRKDY